MSSERNDLSPYELARLHRIKRNEERLRSLGLIDKRLKPTVTPSKKKVKTAPRKRRSKVPTVPTRSSKRLKELKDGPKLQEDTQDADSSDDDNEDLVVPIPEEKVQYDTMPKEPDQLDDDEFQVYVALRKWRLQRKNELEVEPYKICQNKTLCELIRRRRNDVGFACDKIGKVDTTNNVEDAEAGVEQHLLSVWGIGPSKAEKGGFGWEMLEVLGSEENTQLLKLSRNSSIVKPEIFRG